MIRLTAQNTFVLAEDGESPRTISGIAVPWGVEATVSDGTRVKFERGSLPVTGKKPKLLKYHDAEQPVGVVTGRIDAEDGMVFTARISATSEGNDMLELIKDEAVDAVSVGVEVIDGTYNDQGTLVIAKADWQELSLVTAPAFKGATITEVAATAPQEESQPMSEVKVEASTVEAPAAAPQLIWAEAKRPFKLPSAAEYVAAYLAGGSQFTQLHANVRAAAPNVETADTPGILPETIVSNVYNNFVGRRPVVDAVGVKAMPAGGKVFRRPSVTTHTTIGESNGENTALDQGTFVVSDNQVTKKVFGGYVRLSEEDMEWTSPEVMGLLLDDMSRVYANATDNEAADSLVAGATTTKPFALASITDPAYWIAWIAQASSAILTGSNGNLPTHLFVAPGVWEDIVALSDTADRPLFPQIGPMNAFGQVSASSPTSGNAFGLQIVVDRNFAGGGTMVIGDASGFECYERQQGAISVEAADGSLSRYIKFRGQFATLMIDSSKFRKAAFA